MILDNKSLFICKNCFKSEYIKKYINVNLISNSGVCYICGEEGLDISKDYKLLQMLTNIIKYNFPAFQYFQKVELPYFLPGKETIKDTLTIDNKLFSQALTAEIATILVDLLKCDTDIENHCCFDIFQKNIDYINVLSYKEHLKKPLKNAEAVLISKVKTDLETINYYNIFDKYSKIFNGIQTYLPSDNLKDKVLYRSRIGTNKKRIVVDDYETEIEFPFVNEEIHNVPPMCAKSGRFNRMGCSMMYVACNQETAIAESNPDIGHICSVAEFICKDNRDFLDMRIEAIQKINVEDSLIIRNICESLMRVFQEPITIEEKNKYLVTQFFSDIFRELGYAGIIYNSALTTGYNVVAFYPEFIKDLNNQEMVMVKKVKYEFEKIEDQRKLYKNYYFAEEIDEKYQIDEDFN